MTGRNGAGTTYIPGRNATWVTNPAARRPRHGLVEIALGIGELGAQTGDRGIDALDIRRIGEPRALLLGSRPRQRLCRRFQIARKGVERGLRDDLLFEQFGLAIIVLLRQLALRIGLFGGSRRLIESRP